MVGGWREGHHQQQYTAAVRTLAQQLSRLKGARAYLTAGTTGPAERIQGHTSSALSSIELPCHLCREGKGDAGEQLCFAGVFIEEAEEMRQTFEAKYKGDEARFYQYCE